MRVIAIIQARMGSTRLPGKVMMDLGGKPVLAWVVEAAQKAKLVDSVWVATSFGSPEVADWCRENAVAVFIGSEDDVLERYRGIVRFVEPDADLIVRLTADCPMVTAELIDKCIALRACSTEQWPDGMDVQVFTPDLLDEGDTEHVVPIGCPLPQVQNPAGNQRHIRLTVDTQEDLDKLRSMLVMA